MGQVIHVNFRRRAVDPDQQAERIARQERRFDRLVKAGEAAEAAHVRQRINQIKRGEL